MKTDKIIRSFFALVTSLFITLCILPAESYADVQSDLADLQARRAQLVYQIDAVSAKVEALKLQQADVLEQKVALDERDSYILEQISINEESQALYRKMIADKSKELDEAKAREAEQLRRYRTHVRAMEENGEFSYLEIVLKCHSLSDILTSVDDIGEIMESDKRLWDRYIAAREHTEAVKAEYETIEKQITEKINELQAEQTALRAQIQEALDLINSLEDDINNYYAQWAIMIEAHAAASAEIDSITRQLAAERASGGYGYGGSAVQGSGSFSWPLGSNLITSEFGNRNAPTAGASTNHKGLDINAHEGDPIWAADSGTVAAAGYNSGYGNYVLIDHGNGYSTLYAHLSETNVSEGQTVSQGETIGGAGHSGVATGDHLHLEVRQDGVQIDPTSVFSSGLDYSYLYG